jgi:hypothetical protein
MNKENAHEFLPLVQALADGKTIQMRDVVSEEITLWYDLDPSDIYFRADPEEYRTKPEPRTWKVLISKDGKIISTSSIDSLMEGTQYITVQEVLP